MQTFAILILIHAVLFGLARMYARRRLSDKEMVAWHWREAHPYACWLRIVLASGLVMITIIFVLFTAVEVIVQKQSFQSVMRGLLSNGEPAMGILFMSFVIGTIVFSFWYWNGLALYRGRLLEAAENGSANDPRASSR